MNWHYGIGICEIIPDCIAKHRLSISEPFQITSVCVKYLKHVDITETLQRSFGMLMWEGFNDHPILY
ncbi:Maltodextrin phosphorylase [Dirofilaria immitis]